VSSGIKVFFWTVTVLAASLVLVIVEAWDWNGYAELTLIVIAVLYVSVVFVSFVVDRAWQSLRPAPRDDAVEVSAPEGDDQDWLSRWNDVTRRPRVRAGLIALLLILLAIVAFGDRI
jgi:hypothetical protein